MIRKVYLAMLEYYAGDPRRIQHFIKVHSFARLIGQGEGLTARQQYVLEVAALMHDIGIKPAELKYHSSMGKYQELEGPVPARQLLQQLNADSELIERVCFLIAHHHSYTNIEGPDYQILVEADFLVNLYEQDKPRQGVESVRSKIFKTASGIAALETMFGLKQ